jgi:SAM-dependent methyltransferase
MSSVPDLYDRISAWFDSARSRALREDKYIDVLAARLPKGADVLDLGCGMGEPVISLLQKNGFRVTGLDGSAQLLASAKIRFPEAHFLHADMRGIDFENAFAGIVCWHALFHLTPEDQRALLPRITRALKPGGIFIFTSGLKDGEHYADNGGVSLYHASLDRSAYQDLLLAAGFSILSFTENDPDCGGANIWVVQKTS